MVLHFGARALLTGFLLTVVPAFPLTALATGEAGEHVKDFQDHIGDYAADVHQLDQELDAIAERYAQGKEVRSEVAAFVESWEEVKYHGAVEEVTSSLYPPIWQAIGGLRQAVKAEESPETVRERTDRLSAALHQGLGGLKVKAQLAKAGDGSEEAAGPDEPDSGKAFQDIRDHLDQAVAEYKEGNADRAKSLIQDAYFNRFEGLEGVLIEQDADLVTRLEQAFHADLPGLINQEAPVAEVREQTEGMKEALAKAEELYQQAESDEDEVF